MKKLIFLLAVILILSCTGERDLTSSVNNSGDSDIPGSSSELNNRDWELVIIDEDGWIINLNYSNSYISLTRYVGELSVTSYGQTYIGDAWACYDGEKDTFGISCIYTKYSIDRDLNYFFSFDGDQMEGAYFWGCEENTYIHTIDAEIVSGNIGPHGPPLNAPDLSKIEVSMNEFEQYNSDR